MPLIETLRPANGYISNVPPDGGGLKDYLASGSVNVVVLGPQLVESFPGNGSLGNGGTTLTWAYGDSVVGLGVNHGAGIGSGNAVLFVGRALFYIGTGQLQYNGSNIGSLTASSTLNLTLYNVGSGLYNTTAYQAGLSRPAAPTLDVTGTSTKSDGTYSIVYTKVRTATGAESNASPSSNVATSVNQQLKATFPLFGSWTDGTDAYNIYSTPPKFGTTGPWLFLKQIVASDLDGSGNHVYDFNESELSPDTPPVDFNQAPAGTHAFSMGNVFVVAGTYNGVGVSSSPPNYPEAFPPSSTYFLPEILVGALGSPQEGFTFLICKSSVHAAVWTGAPDGPAVIARAVWKNIGFASINNVAIAGHDLYGYVEKYGIVRTGRDGQPDFLFGRRVAPDTASWVAANVAVGYSPIENIVVFGYQRKFLVYHIDMDVWDSPIDASTHTVGLPTGENVVFFYTKNNQLFFVTWNGTTYRTWQWATGTSGSNWTIKFPFADGVSGVGYRSLQGVPEQAYKNIERIGLNGKFQIPGVKIYKNYSATQSGPTLVPNNLGSIQEQIGTWLKAYVRNAKKYQIEISSNGLRERIYSVDVLFEEDPILQG